jgi:hypothetical protein
LPGAAGAAVFAAQWCFHRENGHHDGGHDFEGAFGGGAYWPLGHDFEEAASFDAGAGDRAHGDAWGFGAVGDGEAGAGEAAGSGCVAGAGAGTMG